MKKKRKRKKKKKKKKKKKRPQFYIWLKVTKRFGHALLIKLWVLL
jgi:hypothetical protein